MANEWSWINNPLIDNERISGKNIKIENGNNPDSNLYIIYCSSNGIYFPNNESCFKKRIIDQDKYDWKRNRIIGDVCKHIYIRDIYKTWYVEGINNEINTIKKTADYIKRITKDGSEYVFVGSSAGGYMAICLASILGGIVFAGSPQIQLKIEKKYPFLHKFNTDLHGVVFYPFNLCDFYRKKNKLLKISKQEKMISRLRFSFYVSGYKRTVIECIKRLKSGASK